MIDAFRPGMSVADVLRTLEQENIPCVQARAAENVQLYCDLVLFERWEGRTRLDVSRKSGLEEISWVPDYDRFTKADGEELARQMERRYGPPDEVEGPGYYWKKAGEWLVSASDGFAVWAAL